MSKTINLYLVRHGETILNRTELIPAVFQLYNIQKVIIK